MMHGIQYDAWFLRYRARQVEFFVILDYSLHFYPLNNPENQNFEKMKKIPGDIIILHMCTINQNHMMYGSWDIEHNRYNFSHFKWLFALLHPNNPENQSFEKMKKKNIWRYYHFTQVHQKLWSYAILFLRYDTWQIVIFHLGLLFTILLP